MSASHGLPHEDLYYSDDNVDGDFNPIDHPLAGGDDVILGGYGNDTLHGLAEPDHRVPAGQDRSPTGVS